MACCQSPSLWMDSANGFMAHDQGWEEESENIAEKQPQKNIPVVLKSKDDF